jgi:hypothetical protein
MSGKANVKTLGETRCFTPCLPNELLSYLASLPIEYPGHGHPGVLFYRKDEQVMNEQAGPVEMWIEASVATLPPNPPQMRVLPLPHASECSDMPTALAVCLFVGACGVQSYRLCYSFSAKGTLFNVLADSLTRNSEQQLAGWFFVGEGEGKQYADEIAESMYCQFRLALCKAIAGTEKFLDEATYERTFLACSAMTGVVLLRSAGRVENGTGGQQVGCLRYELHEFSFPLTKQKLRQEIKSKLKSNADMIDCDELPIAGVTQNSAQSCPEVVDLISDDDEPIISLPPVKKPASQNAISDDNDQPAIECGRGSVETEATADNRECDPHANLDGDGLKPAYVDAELARQAEELWKEQPGYKRWAQETDLCNKDPSRARNLLGSLQEQRDQVYRNLLSSSCASTRTTVATVAGLNVGQASSKGCAMSAEPVHSAQAAAATPSNRTENQRQQEPSICFAKLRVGQRLHAYLSCQAGSEKETAGEGGGEALEQHTVQDTSTPLSSVSPDGGKLQRRLHEYQEACNAHRSLFEQAHAKAQNKMQAESGEIEAHGCKYLVENSVLVTILKLALSRSDSQSVMKSWCLARLPLMVPHPPRVVLKAMKEVRRGCVSKLNFSSHRPVSSRRHHFLRAVETM